MALLIAGHQIDYEVRGDGRPLVLLHGLTGDRRFLVESCEATLARVPGVRRIYVDLPGHGRSTANLGAASADALVEALAELIAVVAPEGRPLLLGHAYGAYLVQGLVAAVDAAAVMLVCPVVEPDFGKRACPPRRVARRDADLVFSDDPHERVTFDEVAVSQTRAVLDAYHRAVYPASLAVDRAFVERVRAHYAFSRPYMTALAHYAGPVDVVCGRDDHWVGFEDALRLVRAARRGSFHVLADCGQLLPLEEPARYAALLTDWLGRAL